MAKGFLVIADISGYTSYLSHAELEPAAEHLRTLLDILIASTRPPLHLSTLEGDAVLSYSLEDSFLRGHTLVEMIEGTYVSFRQALDQLVLNNQCDCNACRHVPDLDLKFFVHYGTFLLQPLGESRNSGASEARSGSAQRSELVGSDVNLVHRLTKNSIVEHTGRPAYVAYTEQAVYALGIEEEASSMPSLTESYDHIGEVVVFVQDMHEVWEQRQPNLEVEVTGEQALARVEAMFPMSPVLLWDYATTPETRLLLSGSRAMKVAGNVNGRIGRGSDYHCIDGNRTSLHTIRSWDPPRQYTFESSRPFGLRGWTTFQLTPAGDHTKLTLLVGKSKGGTDAVRTLYDLAYRHFGSKRIGARMEAFRKVITGDDRVRLAHPASTSRQVQVEIDQTWQASNSTGEK